MNTDSANDILQIAGVAIALIISIAWVIVRIRRRNNKECTSGDECYGCSLAVHCAKKNSKR